MAQTTIYLFKQDGLFNDDENVLGTDATKKTSPFLSITQPVASTIRFWV